MLLQPRNHLLQGVELLLHRFGESELHQGPLQVVPRSIAAEIHIALQVIREKAQAKLQGDQADAVGQIVQVPVTQEPTSCLLYTSPSPRDATLSRMPSSA